MRSGRRLNKAWLQQGKVLSIQYPNVLDIIYCNESYYNKLYYKDPLGIGTQLTNPITAFKPGIRACPKANSRAVPSVEAHHHVHGPNIGRNSGGRGIKIMNNLVVKFLYYTQIDYFTTTENLLARKGFEMPKNLNFS